MAVISCYRERVQLCRTNDRRHCPVLWVSGLLCTCLDVAGGGGGVVVLLHLRLAGVWVGLR